MQLPDAHLVPQQLQGYPGVRVAFVLQQQITLDVPLAVAGTVRQIGEVVPQGFLDEAVLGDGKAGPVDALGQGRRADTP
jgi:hypothetical protein